MVQTIFNRDIDRIRLFEMQKICNGEQYSNSKTLRPYNEFISRPHINYLQHTALQFYSVIHVSMLTVCFQYYN
jgi:hypothetical protein